MSAIYDGVNCDHAQQGRRTVFTSAVSHATLSNALAGKTLPSQRTLQAFLTGVGADEEVSRTLLGELTKITGLGPLVWEDGKLVYMD